MKQERSFFELSIASTTQHEVNEHRTKQAQYIHVLEFNNKYKVGIYVNSVGTSLEYCKQTGGFLPSPCMEIGMRERG